MLLISVILFLCSCAVNSTKDFSILYSRIFLFILFNSMLLLFNTLFFNNISKEVYIFGELFNVTLLNNSLILFIYLLSVIIILLNIFHSWIIFNFNKIKILFITAIFTTIFSFILRWLVYKYLDINILDIQANPSITFGSLFSINCFRIICRVYLESFFDVNLHLFVETGFDSPQDYFSPSYSPVVLFMDSTNRGTIYDPIRETTIPSHNVIDPNTATPDEIELSRIMRWNSFEPVTANYTTYSYDHLVSLSGQLIRNVTVNNTDFMDILTSMNEYWLRLENSMPEQERLNQATIRQNFERDIRESDRVRGTYDTGLVSRINYYERNLIHMELIYRRTFTWGGNMMINKSPGQVNWHPVIQEINRLQVIRNSILNDMENLKSIQREFQRRLR